MVRKVTCDHCKGNRYVVVKTTVGKDSHRPCPHCNGVGYKVSVTR